MAHSDGYGIAADYVRLFQPEIERNLKGLESSLKKDPAVVLAKLKPHASNHKVRPILRSWEALPISSRLKPGLSWGWGMSIFSGRIWRALLSPWRTGWEVR